MVHTQDNTVPVNSVKRRVTMVQPTVPLAAVAAVTSTLYTNTSPCITFVLFIRFTMATGSVILHTKIINKLLELISYLGSIASEGKSGKDNLREALERTAGSILEQAMMGASPLLLWTAIERPRTSNVIGRIHVIS